MSDNFGLATKALAAREITGRLPIEMMDEGVTLSSPWANTTMSDSEQATKVHYHVLHKLPAVSTFSTAVDLSDSDFHFFNSASVQENTSPWSVVFDDPAILAVWLWIARQTVEMSATKIRADIYERLQRRLVVLLDVDEWEYGETMPSWSLRWSHFVGQFGSEVKVYSGC